MTENCFGWISKVCRKKAHIFPWIKVVKIWIKTWSLLTVYLLTIRKSIQIWKRRSTCMNCGRTVTDTYDGISSSGQWFTWAKNKTKLISLLMGLYPWDQYRSVAQHSCFHVCFFGWGEIMITFSSIIHWHFCPYSDILSLVEDQFLFRQEPAGLYGTCADYRVWSVWCLNSGLVNRLAALLAS